MQENVPEAELQRAKNQLRYHVLVGSGAEEIEALGCHVGQKHVGAFSVD